MQSPPSADTPGTFTLIVQGTEGDDHIRISPDGTGLRVRIEGKTLDFEQTFSQPISRLEVYGQGGNDHVVVDDAVTVPAFLFGGAGNDVLRAGGGPSVVVGGAGNDVLLGGDGPSILIGGKGHDVLKADSADTILIGGFTDFDANLAALRSLPAELSRTDETFSQKVAHLDGGATGGANGTYALTPSTVHDDHARDLLKGGTADDWFFAALGKRKRDTIVGEKPGDEVTVI